MKKISSISLILVLLFALVTVTLVKAEPVEKTSVLIMFKHQIDNKLVTTHGGTIEAEYRHHPAVSAELPQQAIDAVHKNPNVAYIVEQPTPQLVYQTTPWGVNHIGSRTVHSGENRGEGVNVAIIDTGIDRNHPDLEYTWGYNFYGSNNDNFEDGYGHGTHVAGIIAASDNTIGVVGVAPNANLYILKVFDDSGNANEYVDIIEALEWCIDTYDDGVDGNEIQVISMSWGSSFSQEDPGIHPWITDLYNLGVILVGASGNEGLFSLPIDTVIYPARYSEVIAVGATQDEGNILAWFSSCGPSLELVAPGWTILSTYPDNSYRTMDGTSMACPHVSGTAALILASTIDPSYDSDDDGIWENSEVRNKLQNTADDLYLPGRDVLYGYGLVDADEAANTGPASPPEPNEPPTAFIDSITPPTADYGDEVSFDGHGTDSDGTIIAYNWISSIDGQLSDAQSFTTSSLSDGTHIISFKVQDNAGEWSTEDTQTLVVNPPPPNDPPIAYIDSITPPTADYGDEVSFDGHGTDSDGTIIAYNWWSSIDEGLSTEKSFSTSSLTPGIHTIKFKVQDNAEEWSTEVTESLTINEPSTPEEYCYVESIDFKKTKSRLYISVKIYDHTGSSLKEAYVTIDVTFPDDHIESKTKTTNKKGIAKWWITRPPKGEYTVTVTEVYDTLPYHQEYNKETADSYTVN